MGKAQRIRNNKNNRQNVTGTVAVAAAMDEDNELMDGPRVPLLDKIDDPVSAHRSAAFQALSNLVIDDPETKQALSKKENLKKILAHIVDPELEVRVAAVGTLRNMTQFGAPLVSSELIKNDIFTPLVAVIQQALADTSANTDLVNQLLCQSVALLMNLCENSERALELFSASKILPFFAQFLQPNKYPYDLVVITGQFFFVLTDNNPRAQQELLSIPGYSTTVINLIKDTNVPIRIRTLLAGIDSNIYANNISELNSHTYIWEHLFNSLSCDYSVESQKLFSKLATMEGEVVVRAIHSNEAILVDEMPTAAEKEARKQNKANKMNEKMNEKANAESDAMMDEGEVNASKKEAEEKIKEQTEVLRKELDSFQECIKSQKLALEILTNICSDENVEAPEDMDDEDIDGDDEGEYTAPTNKADTAPTAESNNRSSLIWTSNLYSLVLQLSFPLPPMNTQNNRALENSEWAFNTAKLLTEVQERAVACMGNMLLDAGAKSGLKDPRKSWDCLITICAHSAQNVAVLESATSAMWTLLRLFSSNGSTVLVPSMDNVGGILQLARAPSGEYQNLRSTSIGMLGIIAQLPQFKSVLLDFGRLFLETLGSPSASCVAEALNSIFDVFAETNNNDVVKSLDMLKVLRNYLPALKIRVKNEKKVLSRDVWDRLDEAKMNLVNFLKYKKNQ